MFPASKKQISTIAVALIFSFYTAAATAAPVAPMVRAPGASAGTVSRQTSAQSTATARQPAAEPEQASQPATEKPESTPVTTAPVETTQPVTVSAAATDTAPAASKPVTTSQPKTTEAVKSAAAQKQSATVVPGHPFRIQNKEENYNSLLSKTATRKLDAALADMIGGYGEKVPGLAVIVYKNGREVYRNMMGNRFLSPRNKNWNLPVTSESRFRVASISKIFTATGYMKLVEEGKINLDEDVSRYLGFTLRNPSYPNRIITSWMLLSHTSSLRDYPTPYVPFKSNVKSFFTSADCWTRGKAPGSYFSYCNLNFVLLATIMEKVSGQRFDKYITKNVLKPLDIKGSFNLRDFSSSDLQKMGTLYRKTKGESGRYYAQIDDRPIDLPSASLLSSYRPEPMPASFPLREDCGFPLKNWPICCKC